MTTFKKLIIVGRGEHGKDTVGEIIAKNFPAKVMSSSRFAAMRGVFPVLRGDYDDDFDAMYEDRRNRREEWQRLIREYNTPDLTRLGKELFAFYDVYVGPRNREEFMALKEAKLFDHALWIDAEHRLGRLEDPIEITREDCDETMWNNGSLAELDHRVRVFGEKFYKMTPTNPLPWNE